jgi:putative membrane-bound dehydrogenase-like protein
VATLQQAAQIRGANPTVAKENAAADAADRDYSAELKRIPATPSAKALDTFEVEKGFRLELIAAEPLVASPVALDFDEHGRMYVAEMVGYSENAADKLGRIRVLTDADGDGKYETSTVLADGLLWPTAVLCYDGGAFVGDAPNMIYLKDTNGDGRADVNKPVFTGFGTQNVQGLLNSFRWGLDNRIHVAVSRCGAELRRADQPKSEPLVLRDRNFSFDPKTLECQAESGASQHGYCSDDWGHEFTCQNSDHIQEIMYEDRFISRNPYLHPPAVLKSIGVEGPAADVFRISPVEPWREIRTRLRVKGIVPGPVEGGGRAAGYFTSATGVTIYTGDAWPKEYLGNAFIGDVGSNLVHRKTVESEPSSVAVVARRATPNKEFIASRDNWFRPVQFANGPDGNLYILDMYREVIEHPASLPPVLKKHIDLTSGRDRGRIYRVVHDAGQGDDAKRARYDRFVPANSTVKGLVALLSHPNGWHRTTAARLLYEQNDSAATPLLKKLVNSNARDEGRLIALYSLMNRNALDADALLAAASDAKPFVREHAARLAGLWLLGDGMQRPESKAVQQALFRLADDADIRVRYQTAFALGRSTGPEWTQSLAKIIRRDAANEYMAAAVLSSTARRADRLLHELLATNDFANSEARKSFLLELVREIGARGDHRELDAFAAEMTTVNQTDAKFADAMLVALFHGAGSRSAAVRDRLSVDGEVVEKKLAALFQNALSVAADEHAKPGARADAVAGLALGSFEAASPVLAELLQPQQPQAIQLAALTTLGQFSTADIAAPVLAAWPSMSPALRVQAATLLLSRASTAHALLTAIKDKQLSPHDLDPSTIQRLKTHADEGVRKEAAELLAGGGQQQRAAIIESYRDALSLTPDVAHGREVFRKNCAICHRREGFGTEVGADLATVVTRTPDALMMAILDPNREVDPKYVQYTILTADGLAVSGIITGETATSVTLTAAEKVTKTIPRADIVQLQSTGVSLMPEGLEKVLDKQSLADLIAYLRSQP